MSNYGTSQPRQRDTQESKTLTTGSALTCSDSNRGCHCCLACSPLPCWSDDAELREFYWFGRNSPALARLPITGESVTSLAGAERTVGVAWSCPGRARARFPPLLDSVCGAARRGASDKRQNCAKPAWSVRKTHSEKVERRRARSCCRRRG